MLVSLRVENYALVDSLTIALEPGFTVLTGETGAGKSILVGALQLALGGRADLAHIAEGRDSAYVAAEFRAVNSPAVASELADMDVEAEGDLVVLSRSLSRSAGSSCRINGRPATVAMLRRVGSLLVDFHGQHDHQMLLRPARHLDLVDAFGGADLTAARDAFAALHAERRALHERRERLSGDDREARRRCDLLAHEVREIDAAALEPGEDEALRAERDVLLHSERLIEETARASALLSSDDDPGGARELAASAAKIVEDLARLDASLAPLAESLEGALVALDEASYALAGYAEGRDFDPARQEAVESRLALLHDLKRRYGDSVEEILAYRDRAAAEVEEYQNAEERLAAIESRIAAVESDLRAAAEKLTALRRKAGDKLARLVTERLQPLGMAGARLEISHDVASDVASMTARGADAVQLLLSPAEGRSALPLAKIASGGEISRTMLALRSVCALEDAVGAVVFDEIDAGIGGHTSAAVGREILALARAGGCQVLCVTHSPQIAALADHQIAVRKSAEPGPTTVRAEPVEGPERERELARMLGGDVSERGVAGHAKVLAEEGAKAREG